MFVLPRSAPQSGGKGEPPPDDGQGVALMAASSRACRTRKAKAPTPVAAPEPAPEDDARMFQPTHRPQNQCTPQRHSPSGQAGTRLAQTGCWWRSAACRAHRLGVGKAHGAIAGPQLQNGHQHQQPPIPRSSANRIPGVAQQAGRDGKGNEAGSQHHNTFDKRIEREILGKAFGWTMRQSCWLGKRGAHRAVTVSAYTFIRPLLRSPVVSLLNQLTATLTDGGCQFR